MWLLSKLWVKQDAKRERTTHTKRELLAHNQKSTNSLQRTAGRMSEQHFKALQE